MYVHKEKEEPFRLQQVPEDGRRGKGRHRLRQDGRGCEIGRTERIPYEHGHTRERCL